MFSFFRPKSELCALFEIGSTSVGAALARMTPGRGTEVLYVLREGMPSRDKVEPKRLLKDMEGALARANSRLAKEALASAKSSSKSEARISRVAYSFSSPWTATRSRTVSISRKDRFELTPNMVERAVDAEGAAFERELGGDLSVLERRIVDVSLDGKPAVDPYGKEAAKADVSFFMSLAPKAVIDRALEAAMGALHPKDVKAFSFPLAAFSAVRDALHDRDGFAVLDVGGEVSDLVVAREGHLLEAASFPFGRRHLARRVAQALKTTVAEAESLVLIHLEGRGHAGDAARIKGIIDAAAADYLAAFKDALAKVSSQGDAPREIALLSEGAPSKFFAAALRKDASLSVSLFLADRLRPAVTFSPRADKDASLAIVAAFAARTSGFDGERS